MTDSTDCVICGSELTAAKEKSSITCPSCEETACNACTRRYLSETHDMPHCLFCRKSWVHTFMLETFPSSFLNGPMKTSRQDVLLNEQKAMLPASHGDVQAEMGKRKRQLLVQTQREKVAECKKLMHIEEGILQQLHYGAVLAGAQFDDATDGDELLKKAGTVAKNHRSYKCPVADCRGFLANWECSVCETSVCNKCLAPTSEDHKCDEGAVETMRMIARDTKPCPGCGEGIMKIVGGCDQMWCTGCQTTFSWNTGKKTHGAVHNPHYFDYLRKNGGLRRNPLDVECGGMPDAGLLTTDCRHQFDLDIMPLVDKIRTYIRWLNHNRETQSPAYPTTMDVAGFNTKLRVKFLMGEIDEPAWRDSLYKNEKKQVLKKELGEVIALVDTTSIDIVRRLHGAVSEMQKTSVKGHSKVARMQYPQRHLPYQRNPPETQYVASGEMKEEVKNMFQDSFNELEALRSYANDHLDKVGVSFGCKFPQYGLYFEFDRFGGRK